MQLQGIKLGMAQDLEAKVKQGGELYNQLNQQIGDLGKVLTMLRNSHKTTKSVAIEINQLRTRLEAQLKDLGLYKSDAPSIDRATKFLSAFSKIDDEVKKYINQ